MRVYELAKKWGIASKELIDALAHEKIKVHSHMAILTDEEAAIIERVLHKKSTDDGAPKAKLNKKDKSAVQHDVADSGVAVAQEPERAPKREILEPSPRELSEKIKSVSIGDYAKHAPTSVATEQKKNIEIIAESMLVGEFAEKIGVPASDVILTLLRSGVMSAKNQRIDKNTVIRLAEHYGARHVDRAPNVQSVIHTGDAYVAREHALKTRLPVVVVLGHVDHGKTSLLDYIRRTRVAEKERGGITQHIGAYEAVTPHGNVIFIDTPGHEAFSKIRQRGSRVADIAILVIAADDGIMPQTVEAIKHIKNAKIPVVVAVNKIDKVDPSRIDVIKRQLAQHDLLPEDWGGEVVVVPISAKTGTGVDTLLEMVVLQTQLLELRAEEGTPYRGYVLESKVEKGRGTVATVLGKHGTLNVGDFFICGDVTGKVASLVNSAGILVQSVGPSSPIIVSGFDGQASVGDLFKVVDKEEWRKAKMISAPITAPTASMAGAAQSEKEIITLIIKTDTNSSREALLDAVEKVAQKSPVPFSIIASSIGYITESDIELAYTTGATIIGLHTKAETNASVLAQRRGVTIQLFDIIYKLLEYLEQYAASKREQEYIKQKVGEAIVLKVFDIKGVGVIAGCRVTEGKCTKDSSVVVWRGKYKIGEGKITSLQREKRSVKEVTSGFECGISVEGLSDFLPDDRIEIFLLVPHNPGAYKK